MSKTITITRQEYLQELAIMAREAFNEACSNKEEQHMLQLEMIKILSNPEIIPDILAHDITQAPELYSDRKRKAELDNKKENPFQFFMRVYKSWIGKGITRPDIKRLDFQLYQAIYKNRHNKDMIPANFDEILPKKQGQRAKTDESALKKIKKRRQQVNLSAHNRYYGH